MNKNLNIIPTPQYVSFMSGKKLCISKVWVDSCGKTTNCALAILAKEASFVMAQKEDSDLIVTTHPEQYFNAEELKTFENKYADEQGYLLKKEKGGPVIIAAKTDIGCAYGIVTLSQITGSDIASITIRDWPDFHSRGNKWLIWAECSIWSYDFGDGIDAYKKRIVRKLDMCLKYKINLINADGFGFDTERFPEYSSVMRFICDEARARGIHISCGGYTMGYGMVGHGGAYQRKGHKNRRSYPDGEIYKCIGTYMAHKMVTDTEVDPSVRLTEVTGREWGTCLSNDALFEEKMAELENYIKKTHIGCLSFHNMDAHEIHSELWQARCENCRKKWPNDDIFAKDGCAGAFAEFISKLLKRLRSITDGDYDSSRDLWIRMVSPGYGYHYAKVTNDEDYDTGVKFWGKISEYLTESNNFFIGFREEFFYHDKDEYRAKKAVECITAAKTSIVSFMGCDGFYDDKLFAPAPALYYAMKGFDGILTETGNAFQEPMAVYNAEYLWNCENSSFYNVSPRPKNYKEIADVFYSMLNSTYRPNEVYKDGGFLDIICQKLYGKKVGKLISQVYKLNGENGEPPIACASSVDIYTRFTNMIYPMRWDNEQINEEEILKMKERFCQCSQVSQKAFELTKNAVALFDGDSQTKADLIWLSECFEMGSMLTSLLYKYMCIYHKLHLLIEENKDANCLIAEIESLREEINAYNAWVAASPRKPVDKFGGSLVRRKEIGEHIDYWTKIMLSSIKSGKRIPNDVRPLTTSTWW